MRAKWFAWILALAVFCFTRSVFAVPQEKEGDLLFDAGSYRAAGEAYEKAIESEPGEAALYAKAGRAYDADKWYGRSLIFWKAILEKFGENGEYADEARKGAAFAQRWIAYNLYSVDGDLDGAIALCDKAIKLAPSLWEAYMFKGRILNEQGKRDEAAKVYEAVLQLNPENEEAAWFLKDTKGRLSNGSEAFDKYLQGFKAYKDGDPAGALRLFESALSLAPDFADAHYWAARVLYESKRYPESQKRWKRVLELQPDNKSAAWFSHMAEVNTPPPPEVEKSPED